MPLPFAGGMPNYESRTITNTGGSLNPKFVINQNFPGQNNYKVKVIKPCLPLYETILFEKSAHHLNLQISYMMNTVINLLSITLEHPDVLSCSSIMFTPQNGRLTKINCTLHDCKYGDCPDHKLSFICGIVMSHKLGMNYDLFKQNCPRLKTNDDSTSMDPHHSTNDHACEGCPHNQLTLSITTTASHDMTYYSQGRI